MFGPLSKMIIQVIQLRDARCGMDRFGERPIRVTRISIGVQRPFRIRDTDVKNAARPENTVRFGKQMPHFFVKFEVLERMLAINIAHSSIIERPPLAQIELDIGVRVKEIDVDPSWFSVGSTAEVEFLFGALQKGANSFQAGAVHPVYAQFPTSLADYSVKAFGRVSLDKRFKTLRMWATACRWLCERKCVFAGHIGKLLASEIGSLDCRFYVNNSAARNDGYNCCGPRQFGIPSW